MYLNKIFIFLVMFCLLPLHGNALFGIKARRQQKELLEQARDAYDASNYKLAIDTAGQLILKDAPKRRIRRAYLVLAKSYVALGSYEKALLIYNEAIEFYPQDTEISLGLADVYYTGGLTDKAIEVYNTVLALHPQNMPARLGLARSYYKEGFFTRSSKYFKEYIAAETPQESVVYMEYALSQYAANKYQNALDLINKSVLLSDNKIDYNTAFLRAKIYQSMGDIKAGFQAMDTAYKLAPDDAQVALTYGLWLADSQETKAAIKIADKFLGQGTAPRLALFVKFAAYYKAGDTKAAAKILKTINAMEGDGFIDQIAGKVAASVEFKGISANAK